MSELRRLRLRRAGMLAGQACAVLWSGSALAEDGLQVDASGGVYVARNPFLQPEGGTTSAAVFVQLDPTWRATEERLRWELGATLRAQRYEQRYNSDLSGRIGLKVEQDVSPTTLLTARAAFRTARTSGLDFIESITSVTPGSLDPIGLPDVTFGGRRSRTNVLEAGLGINREVSERERIAADLATTTSYFSEAGLDDYRYFSANLDYRRSLSEGTSGFVAVKFGLADYLGRSVNDGIVLSPTVGIATKLGPLLSMEVGVGVTLTRTQVSLGRHASGSALAARAKLCRQNERGSTCLGAFRATEPTALSGLTTVTSGTFSYGLIIDQRSAINLDAFYTRTDRTAPVIAAEGIDLLGATATYDRKISSRLGAYISPSYTKLFDAGGLKRPANLALRLGVRYRFGGDQ